jgi:hypothetical protein
LDKRWTFSQNSLSRPSINIKKCHALLVIREIPIKYRETLLHSHHNGYTEVSYWWGYGKFRSLYTTNQIVNCIILLVVTTIQNIWKLWPTIVFQRICPKEIGTYIYIYNIFIYISYIHNIFIILFICKYIYIYI